MKITNKLNLPQPFVDAATSEYTYTPKRYSVTSLTKGVREAILQHRHNDEVEQDAADMVWLVFGKAVHTILENAADTPGLEVEGRLEKDMGDGYTLSGIFDLYNPHTKTVSDWKTASTWKVIFNDWTDYEKQLAIYAWLLNESGKPCTRGEIVAILKDHSKTEASRKSDYPQLPVHVQAFDFTPEYLEKVAEMVRENFEAIKYAETLEDFDLPMCSEEERWHKPDKWAVKKPGVKKAVRLLDSREEAQAYIANHKEGYKLEIEYRPGEDTKCLRYCSVAQFCDHGRLVLAAQGGENGN